MTLQVTRRFVKDYKRLSPTTQDKVDKTIKQIATGLKHPGLHAHKMTGVAVWEARVDYQYRITFSITKDRVTLRRVGTHEVYRKP